MVLGMLFKNFKNVHILRYVIYEFLIKVLGGPQPTCLVRVHCALPRDPFTDNNCGPVITQYVEYQMDCIMASETLMELYHNLEKKGLYFLRTLLGTHQWKAWIGKCLFQSVIVQVI